MHFSLPTIAVLLFCGNVKSDLIYVASFSGNITTLSLTYDYFASTNPDSYYSLSVVDTFKTPPSLPAWITLNKHNNIIYLVDGVTTGNGTLTAYRTSSENGTSPPIQLDSVECLLDGAYAGFYANGKGLAVAHYISSALQTYDITASNGTMVPLETFTYTMSSPGPAGARQDAPHIHEARTDPLGQYLLAIDLGADKVRQYAIDMDSLLLDERPALNATPGSGPRHGVFTKDPILFPDGVSSYVFYLAAEIAGTITAYRVTYLPNRGGLQFDLLPNGTYSSLEPGTPKPYTGGKGITGELQVSPDGDFLIASNRRDKKFNGTATQYPPDGQSDSISTFRIRQDLAGKLDFVQSAPAGGYMPRTMNLNSAGNLAVVGIQEGNRVTVLERDLGSGLFKEQVAEVYVEGEIWGVLWDDYNDV
ncbi:putative isomerase YbhE [Aspergillus sclerotiicarbonarius CBS 121057]|uniref:Putative isomerase YbhE n=1 Tax=Aspergillus sclerotiicarbonarius (strain CBS 121057 / IBT 28362) TaxID=1448318 RepID=A0A319DU25_ASPSB|nr:putative isomerase YbhE [Aspergillus sclerotiicarbonarius CBS 121057]